MKRDLENREKYLQDLKEAIKTPLWTTILLTLAFIILLFFFTFIKEYTFLAGKTLDSLIIVMALLPFIIYAVVTGKISEIGGAGFGIKFNKASEAEVFLQSGEVEYIDWDVIEKDKIEKLRFEILPEIANNPRSTLVLNKSPYYNYKVLKAYLKELTKFDFFKYVLFIDINGVFNGYMYARSLLAQFSDEEKDIKGEEIIKNINDWNLDKISGFKKQYIKNYQSNREALRIMEKEGIGDIAVVDREMKFKGFTNREIITSKIVNKLLIKAE